MTDPFDNGYWVKADFARDLEEIEQLKAERDAARAEVERLRKEREERGNRILTRCPACKNDTLVINCGHLLCVWHECPDPCLIDRTDDAKLREALPGAPEQEEGV